MIATLLLVVAAFLTIGMFLNQRQTELSQRIGFRRVFRYSIHRQKRFDATKVLLEIPDFASILWFALSAGESLDSALRIATSRGNGYVATEFQQLLAKVDHGSLLQHELENLALESKAEQIRELATKLAVALVNGTPMAALLGDFVLSVNSTLRAILLAKAGKNETKMMIPLVFVILPVTVMFAMFPSLVLIQQSFI